MFYDRMICPIGQLYHFTSLHGIIASERLLNDPASALGQVQEAVQNQRVPEPGNRVMPLPGMEERLWTAGDAKQNRCGFSAWQASRAW